MRSRALAFAIVALTLAAADAAACQIELFASDGVASVIRRYAINGTELPPIPNPEFNFPTFVTADPTTQTLLTEINFIGPAGPDLVRVSLDGEIVARNSSLAMFGAGGGGIVDVEPSGRGTFFAISTVTPDIVELALDLTPLRRFPSGSSRGGNLLALVVTPDGERLYVTDNNDYSHVGSIRVFDANSGMLLGIVSDPVLHFPIGITITRDGYVVVTDRGASFNDDNVLVFDSAFHLIRQFTSQAEEHANFGPIAPLPNGNIAILETSFWAPSATPIQIVTITGSIVRRFGAGLRNSHGIAVMQVAADEPATAEAACGAAGVPALSRLGLLALLALVLAVALRTVRAT